MGRQMTMRWKINIFKIQHIQMVRKHVSLNRLAKVFEYLLLIILLIMTHSKVVDAQSTLVFLDPPSQTVRDVGDSFSVNVSIVDVSNLYAYQFTIFYDSAVMNASEVTQESFLPPPPQSAFLPSIVNNYNSTNGAVAVTCTLLGNISGISGSGVLATIEFKSLAVANNTFLHLVYVELASAPPNPFIIPSRNSDGSVTVVPEFTSLIPLLALITTSLLSILIKRGAKPKVQASTHS
jgi:hypothetical protein